MRDVCYTFSVLIIADIIQEVIILTKKKYITFHCLTTHVVKQDCVFFPEAYLLRQYLNHMLSSGVIHHTYI